MKIKTRFAPSSTGVLHIGSIRTAFYAWLFAKRFNGSFILRIEDTDLDRSNPLFIKNILKTLTWLGINWDEGPYLQSERFFLYKKIINEMLEEKIAYKCYCSIERLTIMRKKQILNGQKPCYDRKCRNINPKRDSSCLDYVIRFKNPLEGRVIFEDQIRGKIIFNNIELDDLIIQRRNGIPTYNFCVVIDDWDMKVTHVIRGEDHINNTPRQINLLKSLNAYIPTYAHVSMIIDENQKKISKRKDALSVLQYQKEGIIKEALLNYLVRLGWSYGDQEIFNIDEMIKLFSLKEINKSASTFNIKKLLWFNHYYLNKLPINNYLINNFKKYLNKFNISFKNGPELIPIIQVLRKRFKTLKEMALNSYYFFNDIDNFDINLINKYSFNNFKKILKIIYKKLFYIDSWNSKNIMLLINKIVYKYNVSLKEIYMLLRLSITGIEVSPSISIIMEIIGQINSLRRIKKMIFYLDS